MKRRGLTLVELLLSLAMTVVLTAAGMRAFVAGLDIEQRQRLGLSEAEVTAAFESQLEQLLSQAFLSGDANDAASCFIAGPPDGLGSLEQPILTATGETNELTFTVAGQRTPSALLEADEDFEALNTAFGPQGGKAEVNLSLLPFDAPQGSEGLFMRVQRPADGDPTQGGRQQLLSADVTEIKFEFFDGLDWQTEWDTRTQGTGRLPAAVRVTYRLEGEDGSRVLHVRLVHSDVTPENPVTIGGGP